MIKHGLVALLALGLTTTTAMAREVRVVEASEERSIAQLVPCSTPGAAFVSVENIVSSFGSHFTTGSLAQKLDELVSRGLPDPRKHIKDVGIAFNFESSSDRNFALAARGTIDLAKALEFLKAEGAAITQEAYHGVVFNHVATPGERETMRLAALDEKTTLFSTDENADHPAARRFVDTFAGTLPSFGEQHGTVLPKGYFATVSFDIPEKLRQEAAQQPMFAPLAAVLNVTGTLREEADKTVKLDLGLDCEDTAKAIVLEKALKQLHQQLLERADDSDAGNMLRKLKIERDGKLVKLVMEVPRKDIEDMLVGLGQGGEK